MTETVLRVVRALGIRLHAVSSAVMPVEIYSPARKAELLIANAVDSKDRRATVREIRRPEADTSRTRLGRQTSAARKRRA